MAMFRSLDSGLKKTSGAESERDISEFVCPVCLEIYDRPMTTQCGHTFCSSCLQECLRPQKPVCAVCRTALTKWTASVGLEAHIQNSQGTCKGCRAQGSSAFTDQQGAVHMDRVYASHTAACPKFQEYIMEGVSTTAKSQPSRLSAVPNRFTFTCPYCGSQNLDQEGLVEHCNAQHSRDPRQVDYSADEHAMMQEALQRSMLDN
ncbi:E3 ubiquitin-protein ligase RNF114 [Acipenser ruthenus]|uniref:E3 ubiquitin-protein ligase RNF114 n=1 Tax=Acipenser ruthenus TaxID=7906 RepID=A0A444UTX3_ACIRT|nr:E3 ubiquitin-protein ligase RNF114 [Acipenser ruthenus]